MLAISIWGRNCSAEGIGNTVIIIFLPYSIYYYEVQVSDSHLQYGIYFVSGTVPVHLA